MYSPRFFGPTLAFCLPGLLAMFPAVQGATRRPPRTAIEPTHSLSIWHQEVGGFRQSTDAPMVLQVRCLVDRALELQGPGLASLERVRAALSETYGARLAVSAAPPHYEWWFNPVTKRWEIVCLTTATLQVDFGRRGTVVVETRDEMSVE